MRTRLETAVAEATPDELRDALTELAELLAWSLPADQITQLTAPDSALARPARLALLAAWRVALGEDEARFLHGAGVGR